MQPDFHSLIALQLLTPDAMRTLAKKLGVQAAPSKEAKKQPGDVKRVVMQWVIPISAVAQGVPFEELELPVGCCNPGRRMWLCA